MHLHNINSHIVLLLLFNSYHGRDRSGRRYLGGGGGVVVVGPRGHAR